VEQIFSASSQLKSAFNFETRNLQHPHHMHTQYNHNMHAGSSVSAAIICSLHATQLCLGI
jgi:hypothetical protein